MNIRKAKRKDLDEIIGLHNALIRHLSKVNPKRYILNKKVAEEFKSKLLKILKTKKAIIYVTEKNNKILGYSIGIIRKYPSFVKLKNYGELYEVSINPKFRRIGMGSKLALKTIDFFKSKKIKIVEGLVDFRNQIAINAWSKLGFKDELKIITKRIK
jgi:phosphinothricin acetyltransferase